MRAALLALMLTVASQAGAECGNLCDSGWWKTSTAADVQAELDAGADVMARAKYGATPLHRAAEFGTLANIQALLAAGADFMARDKYGMTPLHIAARWGPRETVQALIDADAELMAGDEDGSTPLAWAARSGNPPPATGVHPPLTHHSTPSLLLPQS